MSGPGLTDDDRAVLAAASESASTRPDMAAENARLADPDATPERDIERKGITEQTCRAINDYLDGGHGIIEAVEHFGLSRSTIERHAQSCDYRRDCRQHSVVDTPRCGVMRSMFRGGVTKYDLADRFGVDPSTVTYHIRGRCACPTEIEKCTERGGGV